MPKIKTHKGAAKRFKLTGNGKLKRRVAFGRHLLEKKSEKRKRGYAVPEGLIPAEVKKIKKLLTMK